MKVIKFIAFLALFLATSSAYTMEDFISPHVTEFFNATSELIFGPSEMANFSGSYKIIPESCSKINSDGTEIKRDDDEIFFFSLPEIECTKEYGVQALERFFEEKDTFVIEHDDDRLLMRIGHENNRERIFEFKEIKKNNIFNHVHIYRRAHEISIHIEANCRVILTLTKVQQHEVQLKYYYKFSSSFGCGKHKEFTMTFRLKKDS